jgi:hypothetical protein
MRIVKATAPPDGPFDLEVGPATYNAANRAINNAFTESALSYLASAGASVVRGPHRVGWTQVSATVRDTAGNEVSVLIHGTPDDGPRAGMRRTDTLKKAGFDARALADQGLEVIIVTSHLPAGTRAAAMLRHLREHTEVVATQGDLAGFQRLCRRFGGVPVLSVEDESAPLEQMTLFPGGE